MNNNLEQQIDPVRDREGSQRPSISNGIEAILFFKGEPMAIKKLAEILKVSKEELNSAFEVLKNSLANRGIVLQINNDEVALGTAPEMSDLIENLQKEELNKELSKSALETLSIILYKNGAGRALIDYIRGVNSSFTLRALSVRGLIEKTTDPKDNRRYVYKPSFDLLSFIGVKEVSELPDFAEVNKSIETSEQELEKAETLENELSN